MATIPDGCERLLDANQLSGIELLRGWKLADFAQCRREFALKLTKLWLQAFGGLRRSTLAIVAPIDRRRGNSLPRSLRRCRFTQS